MERYSNEPITKKVAAKKTTSISAIFIPVLAIVVVIGLAVAAFAFIGQQQNSSAADEKYAGHVAGLVAENLSAQAKGYARYVKSLSLDKTAAQLLAAQDFSGLESLASGYEKQSAEVLRVRFLLKEHNETDTDPVVPLSFASLDLANRAKKTMQVPAAEIHAPNSPAQHVALASAVRNSSGMVLGVVHVALSSQPVLEVIQKLPADVGSVALFQRSGRDDVEMARSPAYQQAGSDDGKIRIDNTAWTLRFQPISSASFVANILPAAVILLGTLLVSVMVFLKQAQLRKALRADQQNIIYIVENKLQGKSENLLGNYALEDNREMLSQLSQIAVTASGKAISNKHERAPAEESEQAGSAFPSQVSQTESLATNVENIDAADISEEIFREYDIRGVVGDTLNLEHAYMIGKAIGSLAIERGEFNMLVARDGRISSKDLSSTLIRGLCETGVNVIDLGLMPTPVMYFGTNFLSASSGVMVTGSHNPPDYNGFKIVLAGETLKGDDVRGLYQRIAAGQFSSGEGVKDTQDISPDYIQRIVDDVQLLKPLKVVIDCGHGVASVVARSLFEALGCDVHTLYCEVDGKFPNHHPDPGNPENMVELVETVKTEGADLGIAFDGDGDRLGVVDSAGNLIMPDRVLMLLAADVLLRNPGGDVIYDVKSTRHLAAHILSSGGRPIMWKSGHSLMKAKMKETGALLGGELSGHHILF